MGYQLQSYQIESKIHRAILEDPLENIEHHAKIPHNRTPANKWSHRSSKSVSGKPLNGAGESNFRGVEKSAIDGGIRI